MRLQIRILRPHSKFRYHIGSHIMLSSHWMLMRILVLNYEFPPIGGGGGRASEELCRAFAKRGHEVRVQTSHFGNLPQREQRDGYTIFRARGWRQRADGASVAEMGAFIVSSILPTIRQIRSWHPDVIHVHFAVPTGVVAWI